jgi:hypothetical protein
MKRHKKATYKNGLLGYRYELYDKSFLFGCIGLQANFDFTLPELKYCIGLIPANIYSILKLFG